MPITLIIDWGDTLMREFPQFSGPMATWEQVEALPGAAEMLAQLRGRYPLALATSTDVSDAAAVRAALARVGLADGFGAIFTATELHFNKTDPRFYPAVIQGLGIRAEEAVMIGDSYRGDVLASKAAGLRAIWFNPGGKPVTALPPAQDAEITRLADLPALLDAPWLPDVPTCEAWLAEKMDGARMSYLPGHVRGVAAVAYLLAVWLRQAGERVDPLLAHRGGLLHDLDKAATRDDGERHGVLAHDWLVERGQPALGEIARTHPVENPIVPGFEPRTWEEKLVYLADKMYEASAVVSLEARLDSMARRYPDYAARLREVRPAALALRDDLCARLGRSSAALMDDLQQAIQALMLTGY